VIDFGNIIDAKTLIPTACQNVIVDKLNIIGINQFHNSINGRPNSKHTKQSNAIIPKTFLKTPILFFY
jgi:hypothetical protein